MLIVPIEEAEAGMTLAMHVRHPEQADTDLLKAGYVLDAAVINKLQSMGVQEVLVNYPGLEDLDRHLAANLSPAREQIYSQVKQTIAAVQKTARPSVGFADYYATTRQLVLTLMQEGHHPVYLEMLSGSLGGDGIAHATAVAHLSLVLGIKLRRYLMDQRSRLEASHASEVVNLGVAGMLHDIGKAKLPDELAKCSDVSPPEDPGARAEWEAHARVGYELVRGGIESSAAATILHHHQHFDGSGFPVMTNRHGEKVKYQGERIHVFARIVRAADLFDRLSAGGEGNRRRSTVETLHLMRTQYASWIDPQVLGMLAAAAPPFPPGMKVGLSDGTKGIVVDVGGKDPYRPVVRRFEKDGKVLCAEKVSLWEAGVEVRTVCGKDVGVMIPERAAEARTAA